MEKLLLLLLLFTIGSDSCRRDNSAVESQERLCAAPCTRQQTCRSKDKQCVCDGPCGFVCVAKALKCPPLTPLDNGFVEISNDSFGGNAVYGCQEGYDLQGNYHRTCRGDSLWSESSPECILKPFCLPDNIYRSQGMLLEKSLKAKYFDGESVYFICGREYVLIAQRGYGEIACKNQTWNGKNSTCEPKLCQLPYLPPYAQWTKKFTLYVKNSEVVQLSCIDGYELIGSETITCNKGTWFYPRGAPHCHNVNFEDEVLPATVKPVYKEEEGINSDSSTVASDIVTSEPLRVEDIDDWYDSENFLTSGNNEIIDNEGCNSPHYPNITVSFRESTLTVDEHWFPEGTKLTFRCVDSTRFKFYGDPSQHCSDGHWAGNIPECKQLNATNSFSPPVITYKSDGEFKITGDGTIELPVGSTLQLNCFLLTAKGNLVWSYPNKESTISDESWSQQHKNLTLLIRNMNEDDSGKYSCTSRIGRMQFLSVRVDRHFTLTPEGFSLEVADSYACEFKHPPNVIAWHEGAELKYFTVLPENSVVTMRCLQPSMYAFRGDKQITCHNGEWQTDEFYCERLSRNSEILPPPVNVISSPQDHTVTEDGVLVARKGTTVILDCLWVYPEPGEGWYYPSWFHSSPHGDIELPAEIVQHGIDGSGTHHYSYRISVVAAEEAKLPVTYTCMTPAGLQNQIRIITSDYCLWESLTIPPVIQLNASSIKTVYLVGEKVNVIGCIKGVLLGADFYQCLPNGRWSVLLHRCYF